MQNKIIRVERYLNVFSKANILLKEVEIPDSEELEHFISSIGNEFELYDGYKVNEEQLRYVNNLLQNSIIINVAEESYYILTVVIYDWDK